MEAPPSISKNIFIVVKLKKKEKIIFGSSIAGPNIDGCGKPITVNF